MSRRSFLESSLAASAGAAWFAISGTRASGRVIGANDTINMAVAGINGRGGSHIDAFAKMPNVRVAALVDPDSRLFKKRVKDVQKAAGNEAEVKTYQDIRQALEDPNIDAISIATPNHWHSLMSIWACQAGKDVYVEKPLSHNVREGRVLAEIAKKTGRIVQHGTQGRSSAGHAKKAADIAAGKLGQLLVSRGTCFKTRKSIGFKPVEAVPAGLDFDLWTGPAPKQEFHRNLVHYEWHWFWDFGNGDIGNQGVHQMDVARWMIPNATLPRSVVSFGGRFGYKDQGQTPNTMVSIMDFGGPLLVFEVRGLVGDNKERRDTETGNHTVFDKDKAAEAVTIKPHAGMKSPLAPRGNGGIFGNFIQAVRSRKSEELDAHALEGHYSSALCHLANISYRLGMDAPFKSEDSPFPGHPAASEYMGRMREHLKDKGVKLEEATYRVGRVLKVDAASETIVGDEEANQLLTRNYREGFAVTTNA
jgi:predicted dehydrogenase